MIKEVKKTSVKVFLDFFWGWFYNSFLNQFFFAKSPLIHLAPNGITSVVAAIFNVVWSSEFMRYITFWSLILIGKFKNTFFDRPVAGPLCLHKELIEFSDFDLL